MTAAICSLVLGHSVRLCPLGEPTFVIDGVVDEDADEGEVVFVFDDSDEELGVNEDDAEPLGRSVC